MTRRIRRKHAADDASCPPETQKPESSAGTRVSQPAVQSDGEAQRSDPQRDQAHTEHPAKPAVQVVADGHIARAQLWLHGMHYDDGDGEQPDASGAEAGEILDGHIDKIVGTELAILKKRDMAVFGPGRGTPRPRRTLLDPAALAARCQQSHVAPSAELTRYASVAWTLRWQFGKEEAYVQHVLPDPCVQIVVERGGAHVMGVVTRLFSVTLTDAHFVLGLKFRPGGFRPFMPQPVSTLTNRTVPLSTMFPRVDEPRLRELSDAADGGAVMEALEALLRQAAPPADPQLEEVSRMTDWIATDSTILAVEHAARLFGTSPSIVAARLSHVHRHRSQVDYPAVSDQRSRRSN